MRANQPSEQIITSAYKLLPSLIRQLSSKFSNIRKEDIELEITEKFTQLLEKNYFTSIEYQNELNLAPRLYSIFSNTLVDFLRKKQSKVWYSEESYLFDSIIDHQDEQIANQILLKEAFQITQSRLSNSQKQLFYYKYIQHLENKEIAQELNIRVTDVPGRIRTINKHLKRAIEYLSSSFHINAA